MARGLVVRRAAAGSLAVAMAVSVAAGYALRRADTTPVAHPTLRAVRDVRAAAPSKTSLPQPESAVYVSDAGVSVVLSLGLTGNAQPFEVAQPSSITATDSTGKDLTRVREDIDGNRKFLDLPAVPGVALAGLGADDVRLTLASPARDAKLISFQFKSSVQVYTGVTGADVPVFTEWTLLNLVELDGQKVEVRLVEGKGGGRSVVQFRPGIAAERIHGVGLLTGKTLKESRGGRKTGVRSGPPGARVQEVSQVDYDLDVPPPKDPDAKLRILVRTGIQSVPISVEMRDVLLP